MTDRTLLASDSAVAIHHAQSLDDTRLAARALALGRGVVALGHAVVRTLRVAPPAPGATDLLTLTALGETWVLRADPSTIPPSLVVERSSDGTKTTLI